jgi:hypothetical protein
MARSRANSLPPDPADGLAFLLSQVGAHVAARFAERLEPLGLRLAHVGILGVIRQDDGFSQQAIGERQSSVAPLHDEPVSLRVALQRGRDALPMPSIVRKRLLWTAAD